MRSLGVILLLLFVGAAVWAQEADGPYYRGDQLHRHCVSQDPVFRGICYGYIVAAADAAIAGVSIDGARACIPSNASTSALRNAVKGYLERYPQRHGRPGLALAATALADAFPCDL